MLSEVQLAVFMQSVFESLDPSSVVLPIIALLGLIPVFIQYRDESKLFAISYGLLIVAAVATNLEDLFLETVLNYTEHIVGLMGSGIALFVAGYYRRQEVIGDGAGSDPSPGASATEE